jgi:2-keto-4-pentenoate hydratase/2-oxohepta-3-ene-1,7-dioic acid hydratase in catechol pathway
VKFQLLNYRRGDAIRPGLQLDAQRFDLRDVAERSGRNVLSMATVDALLADWDASIEQLDALVVKMARDPQRFASALLNDRVTLATPLMTPGVIYGAGANYRDHVEAMSRAFNMKLVLDPKREGVPPWHFIKAGRSTLAGHGQRVKLPQDVKRLDWEAELAVVIGREAYEVSADRALEYVAGYTCANDLSARDYLVRNNVDPSSPFRYDWIGHKSFLGSCPLGPVLTPARFVTDPENLDIKLWLNGEIRQDSNTRNHLYNIAEQIEYLSRFAVLYPGDVILTGTPAGVGTETGTFLKQGDVMVVAIEGLGELQTTIV